MRCKRQDREADGDIEDSASTRHDLYETPEVATLSLLAVEPLPPTILEPACGRGAISRVLRRAGHTVIENDIVDYGQGQDSVQDFLDSSRPGPTRSMPSSRIHRTGWRSNSSDTP